MTEPCMNKIRISDAKRLAEQAGADTVVVFAFTDEQFSAVSYGTTKAKCVDAAKWLDRIAAELTSGTIPAPGAMPLTGILQD